jgi:hypothetical protein
MVYDLAWSAQLRRLVVSIGPSDPGASIGRVHLFTMRVDGSARRPLPVEREAECERTEELAPAVLPDGRIAYWSICLGASPRPPQHMRSLMVYDPRTRTTSRYVRRYFRLFDVGWFDFSPTSGAGVLSLGDRLANRLFRLERSGIARLHVPSSNVGKPAWSPDGTRIALSGVPADAGADTPTRTDTPWSVFAMQGDGTGFREIVGGLADDPLPAWSPDGKWLALLVEHNTPRGVWLVRVSTGKAFLLLPGKSLRVPEWLPDGTLVVPVGGAADLGYRGRYGMLVVRPRLP